MGKINLNTWKATIDNLLGDISDWEAPIGQKVYLCEFDIVSGFIYINERGEDTILNNPQENKTNVMVQTSNEPIVAYWKDSFKSIKIEGQNLQRKKFDIGKHYEAYLQSEEISLDSGAINWNEARFNAFNVNKAIHLYVPDFDANQIDIVKKLYLIPNKMGESLQWLRIVAVRPNYNVQRGEAHGAYLTLVNLNLLFENSGRDILTMVQIYQPGGNAAIPYVYTEESGKQVLGIDYKYIMKTKGVNVCQLEFTSPVFYSGCWMYGRTKSNFTISPSKLLLPYKYNVPVASPLQSYAKPVNNYFAMYNVENVYEGMYDSWNQFIEGKFNTWAIKDFNGGLQMINRDIVEGTNPIDSGRGQYSLMSFNTWPITYQQEINYNLNSNSFIRNNSVTFPSGFETNFINHVNNAALIFQNVDELPQSFKDTIRFSLSDIPFGFGNLLTAIIGFDPSWSFNNRYIPSPRLMGVMPCTTYEMAATIMEWSTDISTNKLPFNFFTNNPESLSAFGSRQIPCSFNFSITDRFQSTNSKHIIEGAEEGRGGNGIWDTIYLNQTKFEDGTDIFADGSMLTWDPLSCVAIAPAKSYQEFEIDFIDYKVIGKCDCRMTFMNENGFDSQLDSIYENRHMTNAKYKDDNLLWDNHFVLNFSNNANNDGYFTYPSKVDPPLPIGLEEYNINIQDYTILPSEVYDRWTTHSFPCSYIWEIGTGYKAKYSVNLVKYNIKQNINNNDNGTLSLKYDWNGNENVMFDEVHDELTDELINPYTKLLMTIHFPNTYNFVDQELGEPLDLFFEFDWQKILNYGSDIVYFKSAPNNNWNNDWNGFEYDDFSKSSTLYPETITRDEWNNIQANNALLSGGSFKLSVTRGLTQVTNYYVRYDYWNDDSYLKVSFDKTNRKLKCALYCKVGYSICVVYDRVSPIFSSAIQNNENIGLNSTTISLSPFRQDGKLISLKLK